MKRILFLTISGALLLTGCQSLNLSPLSEGSTENWYGNQEEFTMALNDLYRPAIWYWEGYRLFHSDRFSDDWNQREQQYDWPTGTITSDTDWVKTTWSNYYKGVTRANTILSNVARQRGRMTDELLDSFEGEACFFRACFYSYLIFLWGDIPFYTDYLSIEDAYKLGRTDKDIVLQQIYRDFDRAAELLPVSYSGQQRVTKGAAYAFKARAAIWMLDWETAAAAAKDCMDLDAYSLDPDFETLFLSKTRVSQELIFTMLRSKELMNNEISVVSMFPHNCGGNATAQPSWELLCSFLCTDGLPIDKSPLYDPQNPFFNRDPRCGYTIVEFGTEHLGYIYDPGAEKVLEVATGEMVTNSDTQLNDQYAAYNGLCLKKGVDEEWIDDNSTDTSIKLMRYADVLLMYAEAKIELNQIDATVLEAINMVRARAYKVDVGDTGMYPGVTQTDQTELRSILRTERRMEFAWENRRWFDLVRWRLADKAINRPIYGLPQAAGVASNIASGDFFFPKDVLPEIDRDGLVDLEPLYNTGKIRILVARNFLPRQYLLPIPTTDVTVIGLEQNDGY